jgi:hypothetical protein
VLTSKQFYGCLSTEQHKKAALNAAAACMVEASGLPSSISNIDLILGAFNTGSAGSVSSGLCLSTAFVLADCDCLSTNGHENQLRQQREQELFVLTTALQAVDIAPFMP